MSKPEDFGLSFDTIAAIREELRIADQSRPKIFVFHDHADMAHAMLLMTPTTLQMNTLVGLDFVVDPALMAVWPVLAKTKHKVWSTSDWDTARKIKAMADAWWIERQRNDEAARNFARWCEYPMDSDGWTGQPPTLEQRREDIVNAFLAGALTMEEYHEAMFAIVKEQRGT